MLASALTYSLRDFSRPRLEEYLESRGKKDWFDKTLTFQQDLIFVTATVRLLANMFILLAALHLLTFWEIPVWLQYTLAALLSGVVMIFCSVGIPHALAQHAGEKLIGSHVKFLHALRVSLRPATTLMHWIDRLVGRLVGVTQAESPADAGHEMQQELLSVVEEGTKEGVVDPQERQMIESVIEFRNASVGQVKTARTDIIGLPVGASLEEVKRVLEESGHSRLPVYNGTLDQVVGILYARDLLKDLGLPSDKIDVRSAIRPAFFVPETKLLRDLLHDFREQKVHMAIVLDEYGGTSGLVSIEDVLEELVGDISDEHEGTESAMIKRVDDHSFEADARVHLDELNRSLHLNLPEDAGYETLGGFVSNTLGRIPLPGTKFDHAGARFTIVEAEPQKVNRVKIELIPQPVEEQAPAAR
jgi:CBS domain containing-hemolysin-like protein